MPTTHAHVHRLYLVVALLCGVIIGQSGHWSTVERETASSAITPVAGCDHPSACAHPDPEEPREPLLVAQAPAPQAAPASEPVPPPETTSPRAPRKPPRKAPAVEATDPEDEPASEQALARHEVAERALKWTAAIRGDGFYGAGIVVDSRGYVLTCYHVVKDMKEIRVSFEDTGELPARVVEFDEDLDLALLDVGLTRTVAPIASFLASRIGDEVLAVGSPRRMDFTVAWGIVSYVGRRMVGQYYLQTDLPTNGGNSGGPVVNGRGEVIGVMSFNLRQTQGLSFATPIDVAYARFARHLGNERLDLGGYRDWVQARTEGLPSKG